MLRLTRGLARDGEKARSMWVDVWMPAENEYAAGEDPEGRADLVVDSSQMDAGDPVFRVVAGGCVGWRGSSPKGGRLWTLGLL